MTTIDYMTRELDRHRKNYELQKERNAREKDLENIAIKIQHYEAAVAALEKATEIKQACPWCKAEYTIIDDDFGQPLHPGFVKHCFSCGAKIGGGKA